MVQIMNTVTIMWDDEACVWTAECDSLGIALESESHDKLIQKVLDVAPEMASLRGIECSSIVFNTIERQVMLV